MNRLSQLLGLPAKRKATPNTGVLSSKRSLGEKAHLPVEGRWGPAAIDVRSGEPLHCLWRTVECAKVTAKETLNPGQEGLLSSEVVTFLEFERVKLEGLPR